METLQDTAFHALAEVYTRVVVSTVTVKPHGLVNKVFIQLEENQPKVKSASVMLCVLGAYPEKAAVMIERETIEDSVLTHLRSMTRERKYELASMQGFPKRQLAIEWRLRYSAIANLQTLIVSHGGITDLEQIIAEIDNSEHKHGFMNQFGGNKYHAMKLYSEILHEEGERMKEFVRGELPELDLLSPSQSFSDDEAVSTPCKSHKRKRVESDSESIDSEASMMYLSVTSE
jgi:hypothetical protein